MASSTARKRSSKSEKSLEDFSARSAEVKSDPLYKHPAAFAVGFATIDEGVIVDVRFTYINFGEVNEGSAAVLYGAAKPLGDDSTSLILGTGSKAFRRNVLALFAPFVDDGDQHDNLDALLYVKKAIKADIGYGRTRVPVLGWIPDLSAPAENTVHAWLLLTMLSRQMIEPNSFDITGIFGKLPVVAFTNLGAFLAQDPSRIQAVIDDETLYGRHLSVYGVDKFPKMADYVAPAKDVRLADATGVRLGASLTSGTTVMPAGFVNFNAGTRGKSMVEGRISQGVVVGDGTDIGGGASIMGTLSGGGTERVTIGERVLLGANSGVGFSVGDDSVVEAGLYVTAGTKVVNQGFFADYEQGPIKAIELNGLPNLLLRRNSVTGAVEALPNEGQGVELNAELHGAPPAPA